ncbi:MAG: hypothetical protein DMG59_05120 [Acidobacteria bacterium]|nr:MAG: hypothetical protein DMG59_05120 [Acidobacteriota bacterium]
MNSCLDLGVLQAYLDRELGESEMRAAASHLSGCRVCTANLEAVQSTAARVNALFDALAGEPFPEPAPSIARPRRRGWAAAVAGTLAAAVVLAVLFTRHPDSVPPPAAKHPAIVTPAPRPAASNRTTAPARKRHRRPKVDYFLALDTGDPMQIGTVVEVRLPGSIQAEVIVGDDGRARAIRFLQ